MNSHTNGLVTNRNLANSLEKLSSGLRINKAADDASGMAIADSLRNQAASLGQAISNANDAVGIIQIADKAMDEQIKIMETIKVKATQSAQDGQTTDTRKALQQDITRLMEELDNIAATTSYNGQALLSGQYTNKEFQIGAYSNQTIKASIGATSSDKIGHARIETGQRLSAGVSAVQLTFKAVDGIHDVTLESVKISIGAGSGIGVLAEVINKNSDRIGATATWKVETVGGDVVKSGDIQGLKINGIVIGNILDVKGSDSDGKLLASINNLKDQTGVVATTDNRGRLVLNSIDGRGIMVSAADADSFSRIGVTATTVENYGRLTLTRMDPRDIVISGINASGSGFDETNQNIAEATINLRTLRGNFTVDQACAMGAHAHENGVAISANIDASSMGGGVTTMVGAQLTMAIADTSIKMLDRIRSDLGSVQNQLTVTINNISVTQVNVKSAESNIRDVDFASESANFSKNNILAQSGSYAMSQANAVQQNVTRLLQ